LTSQRQAPVPEDATSRESVSDNSSCDSFCLVTSETTPITSVGLPAELKRISPQRYIKRIEIEAVLAQTPLRSQATTDVSAQKHPHHNDTTHGQTVFDAAGAPSYRLSTILSGFFMNLSVRGSSAARQDLKSFPPCSSSPEDALCGTHLLSESCL
jgi:hypothetical protein